MSILEIRKRIDAELAAVGPIPNSGRGLRYGENDLGRARAVAEYFDDHYADAGEGPERIVGLNGALIAASTGDEIRYVVSEIEKLNAASWGKAPAVPLPDVRAWARRIHEGLAWIGRHDETLRRQVADASGALKKARSFGAYVSVLSELLVIADGHGEALAALPAFDATLLDRARQVVAGPRRQARGRSAEALRRFGLVILLNRRLAEVAGAADFVYGKRSREARAARAEMRRRKAKPAAASPTPANAAAASPTPASPG